MSLVQIKEKFLLLSFTAIFLTVVLFTLAIGPDNTIRIKNVTQTACNPNLTVSLFLNNSEDVAGFQFDLSFPSFLTYETYQLSPRASNATIVVNDSDGLLRMASVITENISIGSDIIINFSFSNISQSSPSDEYQLALSNVILGNINAQSLSAEVANGVFTLQKDDDCDGIINDEDICPYDSGCTQYEGCSYGLKEWLPPIINQDVFELHEGATLPFKFNSTDCEGMFYNDSGVKVRIYNESLGIDKEYNATGEGNDFVTINTIEYLYIKNIYTNELDMPIGSYDITTNFNNNLTRTIGFELVEKGAESKGRGKGPKD